MTTPVTPARRGAAVARPQPRFALAFATLALPTVWRVALATPPLQVADEEQHNLRAVAIGQGEFVARRGPSDLIGDTVPIAP